jgi:uncharacterized protein with gpF-like domain
MLVSSTKSLMASLKKATGAAINKDAFRSRTLDEIIKACVTETANLIKRIPSDYLGRVESSLMRTITRAGSPDLYETLKEEAERHGIQIKNWVHNTAHDQINKTYSAIAREQMRSAGVTHFEWIHSGAGSHPRPLHLTEYPEGLNHGIFSFDDPPVIQYAKGKQEEITGFPGELINCRCKMRPVLKFEVDDKLFAQKQKEKA